MATKLEKALVQVTLDHPFFANILYKYPLKERKDIQTLAVDRRARIYYNPDFVETLTVPQLVWGLCHEILHVVDLHALRMGGRDARKWNIAGDAWINDTLDDCKVGTRIPNTVDMKGSKDKSVEDIYDSFPPDPPGGGQGKGQGQGGSSSGDQFDGDGIGDDLIDDGEPMSEQEAQEIAAKMKVDIAQAAQAAKMRGNLPGKLAEFVSDVLASKTPWHQILERYMVGFTKQDYQWTRPSRRFLSQNLYMPSIQKQPSMGAIALQIDISGSVSAQEIAYYNGHIARIIELCNPEKVHVIYTDHDVHKHEEFEQGEEVRITYHAGGGTDMRKGFEYLDENGIEADVMVTLTDGYTPFPEDTSIPAIWCISSDVVSPTGETVHFDMHE